MWTHTGFEKKRQVEMAKHSPNVASEGKRTARKHGKIIAFCKKLATESSTAKMLQGFL